MLSPLQPAARPKGRLRSAPLAPLQDLAANLASGESAAPDFEAQFLDELVAEMVAFRGAFEQLLAALAGHTTPEAAALLTKALEARDGINAALELHGNVSPAGHTWRKLVICWHREGYGFVSRGPGRLRSVNRTMYQLRLRPLGCQRL